MTLSLGSSSAEELPLRSTGSKCIAHPTRKDYSFLCHPLPSFHPIMAWQSIGTAIQTIKVFDPLHAHDPELGRRLDPRGRLQHRRIRLLRERDFTCSMASPYTR